MKQRFWSKVDLNGPIPAACLERGQCWLWTGAKDPRGYGGFWIGSKRDGTWRYRHAYVVAYELEVGPVPDGLELDHLCLTPSCVRPRHLEAVTHQENMRRAAATTWDTRAGQARGAATKRLRSETEWTPAVIAAIADLMRRGIRPTSRRCATEVPHYWSARETAGFKHSQLVEMAKSEL